MKILVSDFDGVICNGLSEYFYSTQLVYQQIWPSTNPLIPLQTKFNLSRPVVETGWEMPVLLRALVLEKDTEEIVNNWQAIKQEMMTTLESEGITTARLTQMLDQVRQQQIEENLDRWLKLHCFYDGVIDKLKRLMEQNIKLYIITTKEGSFARTLLETQGIILPNEAIFGKEVKRPKYETLKLIIEQENVPPSEVAFIEDRLEALDLVHQQPHLQKVKLFLAQWGYNTELTQLQAEKSLWVELLSLANFTGNDVF